MHDAGEGIVEGAARLFPPERNLANPKRSPGARSKGQPFYNPAMALNRDLSVLLVEHHARQTGREIDVLDALAGTGARSIRLAREVAAPLIVHANDAQPEAVAAIRQTAEANDVPAQRLQITEGDAHVAMAGRRYDIVDLDPCGSPMPFLDAALRATRHNGLVCLTATDTGALSGTFPRVCARRYDAHHGLHAQHWRSEVGLRILAGAAVRAAGRFDRVATPVLSVSHGHWMRVVVQMGEGKKAVDAAHKLLGRAVADRVTGAGRWQSPDEPVAARGAWAGPLWTGPLHDAGFIAGMQEAGTDRAADRPLSDPRAVANLLAIFAAEADTTDPGSTNIAPDPTPFWLVPDDLRDVLGNVPRRDAFIERLRAAGLRAKRTHLDPRGVRTNATTDELRALAS